MQVTLEIKPESKPQRDTVAWFIPGESTAQWLEEIALWEIPTDRLRLCLVFSTWPDEEELARRNPSGVVVICDGASDVRARQIAQPWGCLAGRLYLPIEARIEPAVDESEIRTLLNDELVVLIWHPSAGLIGYEESDLLSVADLITPGERRETDWDRATPGPAFAERLHSITASMPDPSQDVLEDGRDDIGSEPDSLDEIPPAPDEIQPGAIQRALQGFRERIAQSIHDFASRVPASSAVPTWVDRMDNWARNVLHNAQFGDNGKRLQELKRLLGLLDSDPEAGLRKAMPFGLPDGGHRGVASGNRLQDRDADFDLNRLRGGSGPADFWDVPWDIRIQLEAKYRELANREISLGRHRRAAYILGELLGDYSSAAKALEAGGHFHEAAAVFRDHLNQPLQAARCLERGGLLHQAIEIFEEHEEFEDAARLHQQLEQHEQAEFNWRRAIPKCRNRGDYLRAASIHHEHLGESDEALGLLESGVQNNVQAPACLAEWFRLSGSLGRHDSTSDFIQRICNDPKRRLEVRDLAIGLSRAATRYPDSDVRHSAADATRVVVSRGLEETRDKWERQQMLDAVRDLDPSDRLLARDCEQFGRRIQKKARQREPSVIPRGTPTRHQPKLVEFLSWRLEGQDIAACGNRRALYLASGDLDDCWLDVWKCQWDSILRRDVPLRRSKASFKLRAPKPMCPILMGISPSDTGQLFVHVFTARVFDPVTLSPLPNGATRVGGTGAFIEPDAQIGYSGVLNFAVDRSNATWVINHERDCCEIHDAHGQLVRSWSIRDDMKPLWDALPERFPRKTTFIVRNQKGVFSLGSSVLIFDGLSSSTYFSIDGGISDLAVSPEWTKFRLLFGTQRGVLFRSDDENRVFATEFENPRVEFLPDGQFVAVDRQQCAVFDRSLNEVASYAWTIPNDPVAVVSAVRAGVFAVVFADGLVRVMKVE